MQHYSINLGGLKGHCTLKLNPRIVLAVSAYLKQFDIGSH